MDFKTYVHEIGNKSSCKKNLLNLTTVLESAGHTQKQISMRGGATVNMYY